MNPNTDDPRSWDRIERSRPIAVAPAGAPTTRTSTLDAALSIACGEHEAQPGAYCWDFERSGVRGLCERRYRGALGIPTRMPFARVSIVTPSMPVSMSAPATAMPIPTSDPMGNPRGTRPVAAPADDRTRPDHRHPNRHPIRTTRA